MHDNRIKVLCIRCCQSFRERMTAIIDGYQTQCPNCNRMITFDADSQDPGIRRAMRDVRRIRTGYVAET